MAKRTKKAKASATTSKAKAPKKKVVRKKATKAKAAPREVRSKEQLATAREDRFALLPEAIQVGRKALRKWMTNGALTAALKDELGEHPMAGGLTDSDWRNLALRVRRQFSRQPGIMECRARKPIPAAQQKLMAAYEDVPDLKGGTQWRLTKGAKPQTEVLKRQSKGRKPKAAKPKGKGKGKAAKAKPEAKSSGGKKAAPRKRAKRRKATPEQTEGE